MASYWKGDISDPPVRTLYWQHLNHSAVRSADWKLVTLDDRNPESWELYDLSEDRSETVNVMDQHSAMAEELRGKWQDWAKESNVLPFPEQRGPSKQNKIPK